MYFTKRKRLSGSVINDAANDLELVSLQTNTDLT
jgi:hypothetical protein